MVFMSCHECHNQEEFVQVSRGSRRTLQQLGPDKPLRKGQWEPDREGRTDGYYCARCANRIAVEEEFARRYKLADTRVLPIPPDQFNADLVAVRLLEEIGTPKPEVHEHSVAQRNPRYASLTSPVGPPAEAALRKAGMNPDRLWSHQVQAIEQIRAHKNIVISTGTGSGKTLCYLIPILDTVLEPTKRTALYIAPTKALAEDQLRQLRDAADGASLPHPDIESVMELEFGPSSLWTVRYDGDLPNEYRKEARARARLILTNPDMLHQSLVGRSSAWQSFLTFLDYIVLDELHEYRGIFGSHVALTLRRLGRILKKLNVCPQFIGCSATIANPREHAEELTGVRPFEEIGEDGSPQCERKILLYNPPGQEDGTRRMSVTDARLIATKLLGWERPPKAIVFARSKGQIRQLVRICKSELGRECPEHKELVAQYTADFPPNERSDIARRFIGHELEALVATSALELGIDVGDVSVIVMVGYPGTATSFWQQSGRGGRRGQGLVILVLGGDPLQQYYWHHPDHFFDPNRVDRVVINVENPDLLYNHLLCCCAHAHSNDEPALDEREDFELFGDYVADFVQKLDADDRIYQDHDGRWRLASGGLGQDRTHFSLRNPVSQEVFKVVVQSENKVIARVDQATAVRDFHPGAVWSDNEGDYEVQRVDWQSGQVFVGRRKDIDYYTISAPQDALTVKKTKQDKVLGPCILLHQGDITISRTVLYYRRVSFAAGREGEGEWQNVQPWPPAVEFNTEALWLTLTDPAREDAERAVVRSTGSTGNFEAGWHAVTHLLVSVVPDVVACDPADVWGDHSVAHPALQQQCAIFVYDNYAGGVGLSRVAFDEIQTLLHQARGIVKACDCREEDGCPACVQNPRCFRHENVPLHKEAARIILDMLASSTERSC